MYHFKIEDLKGRCTTFEIVQWSTQWGDPDCVDSPRNCYLVTVWRDPQLTVGDDYVFTSQSIYREYFSKFGNEIDGPYSAFYVMNNEGKTIDSFRIPEHWISKKRKS